MNQKDFNIGPVLVWILVLGNILLVALGAFFKFQDLKFSEFFFFSGIIFLFSAWIIVISDISKHKIYNKSFWFLSMFILPSITMLFYLIQRAKLIRLGNKFGN